MSWGLASTLFRLLERLEEYVKEKGLDADKTFFWICDFCIRQTPGPGKNSDVSRLGEVVEKNEVTVMFVEPWDATVATYEGQKLSCLSRMW